MNLRPALGQSNCICFVILSFLFLFSCTKNRHAKADTTISTKNRTTVFSTIQDVYLQDGQGFNREEVYMAKDLQNGYLMFDLSQIEAIGGDILSAKLRFMVNEGEGSGIIEVYRGMSSEWSETDLTQETAPESGEQLGTVQRDYSFNKSIDIDLDVANLPAEQTTLVLDLKEGNPFAFASKENPTIAGSELLVTYGVLEDADTITNGNGSVAEVDETPNEDEPHSGEEAPQEVDPLNMDCNVGGGNAGDTGEKIWCWENNPIPEYSDSKGVAFAEGQLYIDSECYERQVTNSGNRLRFRLEPSRPITNSSCSRDFNMRAEIRTHLWDVRHVQGTEEWFGWSYTFGNDYVVDRENQWKFFQVHPGVFGISPQIGLEVIKQGQFNGHGAGEVYVTNSTTSEDYTPTGITPRAGQTIDVVVHAVWGDNSNGLLQVWIDGRQVYDRQVSTIYNAHPWGGNAKWGIYKWPWANAAGVEKSRQQGITHLETFMGPLRVITRRPGDAGYGTGSYERVAPD